MTTQESGWASGHRRLPTDKGQAGHQDADRVAAAMGAFSGCLGAGFPAGSVRFAEIPAVWVGEEGFEPSHR